MALNLFDKCGLRQWKFGKRKRLFIIIKKEVCLPAPASHPGTYSNPKPQLEFTELWIFLTVKYLNLTKSAAWINTTVKIVKNFIFFCEKSSKNLRKSFMQKFFLLTVSTAMPTCIFERMTSGVFAENFSLPHTAAVIQQAATIDGGTMMNFSSERICQNLEHSANLFLFIVRAQTLHLGNRGDF